MYSINAIYVVNAIYAAIVIHVIIGRLEYLVGTAEALSVRQHLRSDVPLCSLLSGGIDSSIIASVAGEQQQDETRENRELKRGERRDMIKGRKEKRDEKEKKEEKREEEREREREAQKKQEKKRPRFARTRRPCSSTCIA